MKNSKADPPFLLVLIWILFIISATFTENPDILGLKRTLGLSEIISLLLLIYYAATNNKIPIVFDETFKIMLAGCAYGIVVGGIRTILSDQQFLWARIPVFGFLPLYYSCLHLYFSRYPVLMKITVNTMIFILVALSILAISPIKHIGNIPLYFTKTSLGQLGRFKGLFRNPNQTAFFIIATSLVAVVRIKKLKNFFLKYAGLTIISILSILTILKTGSDAASVCIFLFPIVFIPIKYKMYFFAATFCVLITFLYLYPDIIQRIYAKLYTGWNESDQGHYRLAAYASALDFLVSTFSFGSGFSTWIYGNKEVHNVVLDLMVNFGAALGLTLFWIIYGKNTIFSFSRQYQSYRFAQYCNIYPVLLLFSFAHLTFRQRILWITIALVNVLHKKETGQKIHQSVDLGI